MKKRSEKTSWPELWGIEGEAAEAIIKRDNPNVDVISLPVGSITIHDFNCNRVWLFLDSNGFVATIPKLG
ncbi:hypothetical protein FEM48_Zijuj07G0109600 [Ziziphus jujuba var. spinosa]|uniref:Uncharacterized protein n=1 Tax=Ziziphus jujuba var. spinosa TaxID=714518 RepID=A0A978V485_ZIZJJ|nr:hypothetical protein FEM48_Zijuj07G0109600 [Ziziphus jujuba var. spinosa]